MQQICTNPSFTHSFRSTNYADRKHVFQLFLPFFVFEGTEARFEDKVFLHALSSTNLWGFHGEIKDPHQTLYMECKQLDLWQVHEIIQF